MVDFDRQIAATEARLVDVVANMADISRRFVACAVPFVAKWYVDTARREVENTPEVSNRLTDEQLSALKKDVQALSNIAAEPVDEFLGAASVWWHRMSPEERKRLQPKYDYYGNRAPATVDKPLRLALGRLAPVLERFGYLQGTRGPRGMWFGIWREWDSAGQSQPSSGRPYYPSSVDWTAEMRTTMKEYETAMASALRIEEELAEITRNKAKASARKRWDSA